MGRDVTKNMCSLSRYNEIASRLVNSGELCAMEKTEKDLSLSSMSYACIMRVTEATSLARRRGNGVLRVWGLGEGKGREGCLLPMRNQFQFRPGSPPGMRVCDLHVTI
ncbi:hypothetical protein M0802_010358 [Mischocyttarus mexicanus]|nr:hypothetical protein M0802_010358 [Mischocyttarus mexicanus]